MKGWFPWLLGFGVLTVVVGIIVFWSSPPADTLAYQGDYPEDGDGAGNYMPSGY